MTSTPKASDKSGKPVQSPQEQAGVTPPDTITPDPVPVESYVKPDGATPSGNPPATPPAPSDPRTDPYADIRQVPSKDDVPRIPRSPEFDGDLYDGVSEDIQRAAEKRNAAVHSADPVERQIAALQTEREGYVQRENTDQSRVAQVDAEIARLKSKS